MMETICFYRASDERNTYEKHVPAPYLRTEIAAEPGCRYTLTVTGLGFYELYLNGKSITKGLLAPYISNPDDIVYFDTYDITDRLSENGNTAIGLILGNGMRNPIGGRVWGFDESPFPAIPCFAVSLTKTDADGAVTETDLGGSFRWHPSPILFDDLRSGCFYDANKEIPGWNTPGFDDKGWAQVQKTDRPRGEYRICEADPIVINEERAPALIREAKLDRHFDNRKNMRLNTQYKFKLRRKKGVLFDFGLNTAGVCRLQINGKKGQQIIIQFCEFLTEKGCPSYRNTGSFYPDGYGQTLLYICKGEENETFVPSFCYYGFRYAVVFGLLPEQVRPETLTMLRANSDLQERGAFTCSDDVMNALGDMARVSDLANFWYFPTDCPHREKNGWTGDAAVSAEHMLLTLTPEKNYKEWLRNICKAQRKDGAIPCVVPTDGRFGFTWGNGPAWDNVLSELCWQIYRMRGDLSPAVESADALYLYLSFLNSLRDENGLISYGLGDWCQPGHNASKYTTPELLSSSVMGLYIAQKTADLFDLMGKPEKAAVAVSLRDELKAAVRARFLDSTTMAITPRTQTAQAICIYYGVFEPGEIPAAGKVLETIIHENGDHFDCGMIGMRVIFHVLSNLGLGDLAYKMITRDDFPSYGMFVKRGLTALPEDFLNDNKRDEPNSLNHHFFGDIVSWFLQRVVGISVNPDNTDANETVIRPDFLDALTFAEGHYNALCGKVFVKWEKTGDAVLLTIEAPEAVRGSILLPDSYTFGDAPGERTMPLRAGRYLCVRQ